MRLFIDTNIVLDFLMNRKNGKAARDVLKLAEDNLEYECVTASSVTDILFLFLKSEREKNNALDEKDRRTAREIEQECVTKMNKLFNCIHILTVTEENIRMAFTLGWDDTEDALQYVVAKANSIDMIITNNVKDYILSDIPVMNAAEFLVSRNTKN